MTKQLEALITSIKDTIDDAILNYGESWDSALVQVGANTAVHAICSDAIGGEIVVYAADGSHESSWLCDYLESVSPENVKALIAALEQAQQRIAELETKAEQKPMFFMEAKAAERLIRGYTRFATVTNEPKEGKTLPLYVIATSASPLAVKLPEVERPIDATGYADAAGQRKYRRIAIEAIRAAGGQVEGE